MNNVSGINLILKTSGEVFYYTWWILLPIMFYFIFQILWKDFVAAYSPNSWHLSQKWTYLELVPPRDIERGPKIMENIFSGITGVLTSYNTFGEYIEGAFWHDRFSLELVGDQGKVHFYIRVQKKYKKLIEAQVYAQYPDAEILEFPDYTQGFPRIIPNKFWDLWGTDFEFVAEEAIPIKTYDKFEESVTGEMIDPIAAFLEVLGTLEPGQHAWLQYIIQPLPEPANKKYEPVVKRLKEGETAKSRSILGDLADVFTNIFNGMFSKVEFNEDEDNDESQPLEFRLSPIEKERLKITEEKVGQNLFSTKMRLVYLGRRENFDRVNVSAIIGAVKQFNDLNMNQVKPEETTKTYGKIFLAEPRANFRKRKIYNRYINRSMDGPKVVFSVKELATLFHFPDINVKSPSIRKVESKLGAAPSNLPIK